MKYSLLFLFILCLLDLWFSGCGGQVNAGTDTGNPVLTARVVDEKDQPLGGALVLVYSYENHQTLQRSQLASCQALLLDSLWTDSLGQVYWKGSAETLGFEVYWADSLGVYQSFSWGGEEEFLTLAASPLARLHIDVNAPKGQKIGLLRETGKTLVAGTEISLPAGTWSLEYFASADQADTLPALNLYIPKERETFLDWNGLRQTAQYFDSIGLKPRDYGAFRDYPLNNVIRKDLHNACENGGFAPSQCGDSLDCLIWFWNWKTDWKAKDGSLEHLYVASVLGNDQLQCVFLATDTNLSNQFFYSIKDVEIEL